MTSTPRSDGRSASCRFTPSATIRSASMSSPESVSSRMAMRGESIAIWSISIRFFSPPVRVHRHPQEVGDGHAGDGGGVLEGEEEPRARALVGLHVENVLALEEDL